VLLGRDLRVHDNPAPAAACRAAECVLPLFVLDTSRLSPYLHFGYVSPREGAAPAREDAAALAAWRDGRTGVPIVDARMRQLATHGWLPDRARLVTASFLVKHLGLDWRDRAAQYAVHLLDADVASDSGNWQWLAGVRTDTRPYRSFNPVRQAERFDPDGEYVRRHVPELAGVAVGAVHRPWRLGLDHPPPLRGPGPARWLD
jgi:deoxyribodipyrimidine photo-lyase